MSRALSLADLRRLRDAELIERHDAEAENTVVGVNYYLDELARRESKRQLNTVGRLTWVIAFLTAVNVVLVAISVWD